MGLRPPPRNFDGIALATKTVSVANLYRVTRHRAGEPFFGKSASNRFDDRSRRAEQRFGSCYCGLDLETAIAETVLHDEMAASGKFSLSYGDFASRRLVRFDGDQLTLADLTGVALKTLGADGSISTLTPYRLPQLWSMAVHQHSRNVDGILYVSRHVNDRLAAVVYERAATKLGTAASMPLLNAPGVWEAIRNLHISFDYP